MAQSTIYATRSGGRWWESVYKLFLLSLDLSEALIETTKGLKSIPNGIIALIMVLPAVIATHFFFVGSYVMDFDSTLTATEGFRKLAMERMAWMAGIAVLAWSLQVLGVTFAFFSTAIEFLGARFAHFNLPSWKAVSIASIIFDAVTDTGRVNYFLVPLWGPWTNNAEGLWGVLIGGPATWFMAAFWCVCWALTLLASSYYLELLFVIALWSVFGLLWKSFGYWVMGMLAGKDWKQMFNAQGGFSDDAVSGGRTASSRPGPRGGPRGGQGPRGGGQGPRGGGPGPRGGRPGPRRAPVDDDFDDDLDDDDV